MEQEAAPTATAVARIQRLDASVVNRIAAGEVVHRPANALKELLENSLDAQASQITITVNQGGLKLLQIQDNGKGIHRQDLDIVCERFTTSKLRQFDDLKHITSFGFRGEALASISHVAHVSIISKTRDQPCAYKAFYRDGKLVPKVPGGNCAPTPCAGKDGTQIIVEDLFYNLSTRKQALKNASEQYQRLLEVVQRYAVHFAHKGVGFVCKKQREMACDVNTLHATSQIDVIRNLYGKRLADELLEFSTSKEAQPGNPLECRVRGFISNANYHLKKIQFLLFINDRLVDCNGLKRACEETFALYLPKHTHPFVYLSIELPGANVDVNVHPTKREVHFLFEEELVALVNQEIDTKLKGSNESRVFLVQPISRLMSQGSAEAVMASNRKVRKQTTLSVSQVEQLHDEEEQEDMKDDDGNEKDNGDGKHDSAACVTPVQVVDLSQMAKRSRDSLKARTPPPNHLVRTDHRSNTIDKYCFLASQRSSLSQTEPEEEKEGCKEVNDDDDIEMADEEPNMVKRRRLNFAETEAEPDAEMENVELVEQEAATRSEEQGHVAAIDQRKAASKPKHGPAAAPASSRDSIESLISPTQSQDKMDPMQLTSVQNLLQAIHKRKSVFLTRLFQEHTFVGVVDDEFSLLQYQTKLFLVRHERIAFQLFYEKVLQRFGRHIPLHLATPLSIEELVVCALDNPRNGYNEEDGSKRGIAQEIQQLLISNGPMLAEYFALDVDGNGFLRSLPQLLADYEPSMHLLPEFLFQLATEVNWEEEQPCFEDVAQALAKWYAQTRDASDSERSASVLEHVVFPATKSVLFTPPHALNDAECITPIACLTKLYRIFERC